MSEPLARNHGLRPFLRSAPNMADHEDGMSIHILPTLGHINLRGSASEPGFVTAVTSALGQSVPVAANTMTIAEHHVYWLGPDEWLVVAQHEEIENMLVRFREIGGTHAAVTDVSGGNITMRLAGRGVREVLAKGCTLDFHPEKFRVSICAQSGLASTTVLIGHVDERPVYEIVVRRSFSEYLALWLQSAAREFGVTYTTDCKPIF